MRAFAFDVVQTLRQAGFSALWAGGCVRDLLLGQDPHDYDVATDARPAQVQKLFKRTIAVGAQFGVIEVLGPKGMHVQVATFRSDESYSDGRHPDAVRFSSPQEDAQRRDFTINGLFFDPIKEEVIDYVGGQADLKSKIVRAIGNAPERIKEDKLRMLRAVRFVSRLGFQLDPTTRTAIKTMSDQITQVSAERITDELKKMLTPPTRASAITLMLELSLLANLLPEATNESCEKTFMLLTHLPEETVSLPLAWASLLFDLGICKIDEPPSISFLNELAARFRLSNQERDHISWLIQQLPLVRSADQLEWADLKPILASPLNADLLTLLDAACVGLGWQKAGLDYCRERLQFWTQEQLDPPALVTGEDVANLNVKRGPDFKKLLDAVRGEQLNEKIKTRDEALDLLKRLAQELNYAQRNDN
jgi:tRNA nucleotidyltransferase/poly(A) polymerase